MGMSLATVSVSSVVVISVGTFFIIPERNINEKGMCTLSSSMLSTCDINSFASCMDAKDALIRLLPAILSVDRFSNDWSAFFVSILAIDSGCFGVLPSTNTWNGPVLHSVYLGEAREEEESISSSPLLLPILTTDRSKVIIQLQLSTINRYCVQSQVRYTVLMHNLTHKLTSCR